jgi:hypothetical protein
VVVAVNNYFSFIDWKQTVDIAKCCIAKKQSAQVSREANLMGRCSDIDADIQFLQSSLYLLNNYTYSGDFNQITDAEASELIQRIGIMCNCEDTPPYTVEDVCPLTEICVSGTYQEDGGDLINIPPQTVYPSLNCTSEFTINALTEMDFVLEQESESVWNLYNDGEVVATSDNMVDTYSFTIDIVDYNIVIASGACITSETLPLCGVVCVSGSYTQDGGDSINLRPQTVYPDLSCTYVFTINAVENVNIILSKNGSNWEMINDGDVLDTNATVNGTYLFSIGDVSYSIVVSLGECL